MKWPLLQCRTAPQLENSTIDRQLIVQQDSRVKVLVPEIMSHEDGVRLFTFLHCKQFNDSISLTAMEKDDRRIQHVKIGSLFKSSGITTKTNNGATVVMWKAKRKRKLMDDSIWYNGVLLKTGKSTTYIGVSQLFILNFLYFLSWLGLGFLPSPYAN